jgi:hypothetical protein
MRIFLGDFNAKDGKEDILNRHLVTRVYMKPVTITGSE